MAKQKGKNRSSCDKRSSYGSTSSTCSSSSCSASNPITPTSTDKNDTEATTKTTKSGSSSGGGGGMYDTYKKCTEAVKQWAILTWDKKNKVGGKQTKNNISKQQQQQLPEHVPISTIMLNLHELATMNTIMPLSILHDLKMAIRLRRQASVYYNYSNQSFCEGHEWIINQLVLIYNAFRTAAYRVRQQQQQKSPTNNTNSSIVTDNGSFDDGDGDDDETDGVTSMKNRFAVLATVYGGDENDDDDSSLDGGLDNDTTAFVPIPTTTTYVPKEEIVQEEERQFAIACALLEVENLRQHIRTTWKDWALTTKPENYNDITTPPTAKTFDAAAVAKELLTATCISRYGILMAKSAIMSTCVEFDAFTDFDEIFKQPQSRLVPMSGYVQRHNSSQLLELGQNVIVTGLVAKPEFNDKCGTICTVPSSTDTTPTTTDRYGVRLGGSGKVLSIKPTNLLLSDDLLVGLHQVYEALSSFTFPPAPSREELADPEGGKSFDMKIICQSRDRRALLQFLTIQFLPIWNSFGDYAGDVGPGDSLFCEYLKEFYTDRTINFHWVFLLLCMIDSTFDCYHVNHHSNQVAIDSVDALLRDVCDANAYEMSKDYVRSRGGESIDLWTYNERVDCMRQVCTVTSFPWLSGDVLLQGFHLNLVAASGLPYFFWNEFISILHLYSMLRQEGYIAMIPDIENTLIRLYRQQVFFRSGVPQSGSGSFLASWQVSLGLNTKFVPALKGGRTRRRPGGSKHDENRSGLLVTEMSRLLAIVQWQEIRVLSNPIVCFDEIRQVVNDEFHVLFRAPLMMAAVQMIRIDRLLVTRCPGEHRAFCDRWLGNYNKRLLQMNAATRVCFWAFSLADRRSLDPVEIRRGLQMIANCFGEVYGQWCIDRIEITPCIPFTFNPNEHKDISVRWGQNFYSKYGRPKKV
jgi:hypothetical protein